MKIVVNEISQILISICALCSRFISLDNRLSSFEAYEST